MIEGQTEIIGAQKRWPQRFRPTGKPFRRNSCSHCKWKSFIILSLRMGVSYQTFSLFSSLHLSYPTHCIYHSLSLPPSDSTCICCATPHFSVSSFYILSVLLLALINVFSVVFVSLRSTLMLRHRIFMAFLPALRLPCDGGRAAMVIFIID